MSSRSAFEGLRPAALGVLSSNPQVSSCGPMAGGATSQRRRPCHPGCYPAGRHRPLQPSRRIGSKKHRKPKASEAGWAGPLDLQQRPLAPQGPPPDFHGVAPMSTECHPAEITEVCRTGSFHTKASNAYKDTPFGAPVARLTRVRWLTPGEKAARLQVCRATVYKLCETDQLEYARVGLSIRISEAQLEAFLARVSSPP